MPSGTHTIAHTRSRRTNWSIPIRSLTRRHATPFARFAKNAWNASVSTPTNDRPDASDAPARRRGDGAVGEQPDRQEDRAYPLPVCRAPHRRQDEGRDVEAWQLRHGLVGFERHCAGERRCRMPCGQVPSGRRSTMRSHTTQYAAVRSAKRAASGPAGAVGAAGSYPAVALGFSAGSAKQTARDSGEDDRRQHVADRQPLDAEQVDADREDERAAHRRHRADDRGVMNGCSDPAPSASPPWMTMIGMTESPTPTPSVLARKSAAKPSSSAFT